MPSRLLLTVFATLNIAGGLACILAPALMLRSFGVVLPPMGIVIYQFWGVAVAGTGALLWLLRNRCGDGMPVPLVSILVVMNTLNAAIAVRGQFSGANASGWAMVALYVLLALAFLAVAIGAIRRNGW